MGTVEPERRPASRCRSVGRAAEDGVSRVASTASEAGRWHGHRHRLTEGPLAPGDRPVLPRRETRIRCGGGGGESWGGLRGGMGCVIL